MRRILFSLVAVAALGQDAPFRIDLSAPRTWVLAGRELQIDARVYTDIGEMVDAGFSFRSSNPVIATVDGGGMVRGLSPGRVEIEASSGAASGSITIWVHVARIEIQPARMEVQTGQTITLSARALDADGRTIAAGGFTWSTTLPGVATIDSSGAVRGVAAGQSTLTAALNLPDSAISFSGQAQVVVRSRPDFRIERWYTSDANPAPVTVRSVSEFSYAGGRTAAIVNLSNGGLGLVANDGNATRLLHMSGQFLEAAGSQVFHIGSVSVNSRGDIATTFDMDTQPWSTVVYPGGRPPSPLDLVTIQSPPGECCMCCPFLGPRSLADSGDLAYGVNDRGRQTLWYRRASGSVERLNLDNLPGVGTAQWLGPINLFGPLNLVFQAGSPNASAIFHWNGREIRKIVGNGDVVPQGIVSNWSGDVIVDGSDFYARLGGQNFSMIARLSGGAWTKLVQSEQFGGIQIHGPNRLFDARNGTLLFEANTDQGGGLFKLTGNSIETVGWFWGGPPGTVHITNINHAFLTPDGKVVLNAGQGSGPPEVGLYSPGSTGPLIAASAPLGVSAPVLIDYRNLWSSAASSTALIARTPSNGYANVVRGGASVMLSRGDTLSDGAVVSWINNNTAANRAGEILINLGTTRDNRAVLLSEGRVSLLAKAQDLRGPGGQELCCFTGHQIAMNNRRQWVAMMQYGGQQCCRSEMMMFPGAGVPPRSVTNNTWPSEVVIDERARVAYTLDNPGRRELHLWDNGQTRRVLQTGDTLPGGMRVNGFGSLRAAGEKFYLILNSDNGSSLAEYDGTSWRTILGPGTRTSHGNVRNFCCGGYSVNSAGEIAGRFQVDGGSDVWVSRRRDGRDLLMSRWGERLANGDWTEDLRDVVLTDSGEIYFTAKSGATWIVYRATAQ